MSHRPLENAVRAAVAAGLLMLMAGCGGGGTGSESSLYGYDKLALTTAAVSATIGEQAVQLHAFGTEYREAMDSPRRVAIGVALMSGSAGGATTPASGDWAIRTLWVFRGDAFVSSRDLQRRGDVYVAIFDDPPFSHGEPLSVTAEYIVGTTLGLLRANGEWL